MKLLDGYTHYCMGIGQDKVDNFCKEYNLTKEEFNHLIELIRNSTTQEDMTKRYITPTV